MVVANAAQTVKSVADPNAAYESMKPIWEKARAVCGGERFVKEYDGIVDPFTFTNLLIPFSPSMTPQQYNFYKAEAELPGIVREYHKMVVGGLLRKEPQLALSEKVPKEAKEWILSSFGHDSTPLLSFLDTALKEEILTNRAWIYVSYPRITDTSNMVTKDFTELKPYPVLWKAEDIINWHEATDERTGKRSLTKLLVRGFMEDFSANEFHPTLMPTVWVHEIVEGRYQIRVFKRKAVENVVPVVNGQIQTRVQANNDQSFELIDTITEILMNGEYLSFIPAWPMNGSVGISEPILTTLVDREVSLYNKISRRNHLLYGAATYTPVVSSDMSDEQFDNIVEAGLGSWIHVEVGATVTSLATPTEALDGMEKAISSTIDDMGKLGARMLTPETAASGIALEIRNAPQTASIGTLNTKISSQLSDIIAFMVSWRYDIELTSEDIRFTLSPDFNPAPLGADWLRLVTEWYQSGLIPRSEWLSIGKHNDIISADYDDDKGQLEINSDELITGQGGGDYADKIQKAMEMKLMNQQDMTKV